MKRSIILIGFIVMISLGCKKEEKEIPQSNEIFMINSKFDPSSYTVSAGTTIVWTNKESMIHTVTSTEGKFNSGDISKDQTFSFTFNTIGTYQYVCLYHSDMKATIIVK